MDINEIIMALGNAAMAQQMGGADYALGNQISHQFSPMSTIQQVKGYIPLAKIDRRATRKPNGIRNLGNGMMEVTDYMPLAK